MFEPIDRNVPKHLIIRGREIVEDDWTLLRLNNEVTPERPADTPETVAVPAGKVIVPLTVWLAQRETLQTRSELGVWIASDERPETLRADIGKFAVIAVDFPKFTDGRGYSIAYNLRMRLGYKAELRAIGDVLRDQLFAMQRVGFDAYDTRPDRSIHDALKGLTVFSEVYQSSVDQQQPLYRRQLRDVRSSDADVGYGI